MRRSLLIDVDKLRTMETCFMLSECLERCHRDLVATLPWKVGETPTKEQGVANEQLENNLSAIVPVIQDLCKQMNDQAWKLRLELGISVDGL